MMKGDEGFDHTLTYLLTTTVVMRLRYRVYLRSPAGHVAPNCSRDAINCYQSIATLARPYFSLPRLPAP